MITFVIRYKPVENSVASPVSCGQWRLVLVNQTLKMSAARKYTVPEDRPGTVAGREMPAAANDAGRDNPLQLLRDAISQLKSSTGVLPDREQMATLLAEAREALDRADVVARVVAKCDAHIAGNGFDEALAALEEGLGAYPGDPILVARRQDVQARQRAFHSAAAARGAIEEARWLLEHDRTDLAAEFLKQKAEELPDQDELTARLAELQALLPEWEEKRQVRDALARALTLEKVGQWQAALTVIDEAREAYASNVELRAAAERIGERLAEDERRKKLARRIELIRQQMAAGSWRQALALVENTQQEFPHANELEPLSREVSEGLRRSEREGALMELRKCLADGELDTAEQALQRARSALGDDPALEALSVELLAEKRRRSQLRQAQVLFGRRQFEEAERILSQPLDQDRPEWLALLAAVRAARAATEEQNSLEEGREKAHRLVAQKEFAQAADLLRNLLALFPGNPILQRDLEAAQAGLEQQLGPILPAPGPMKPAVGTAVAPEPAMKAPVAPMAEPVGTMREAEKIFKAAEARSRQAAPPAQRQTRASSKAPAALPASQAVGAMQQAEEIFKAAKERSRQAEPPAGSQVAAIQQAEEIFKAVKAGSRQAEPPAQRQIRALSKPLAAAPATQNPSAGARGRFRVVLIAGAASLVLALGAGIAWKQSASGVPAAKPAVNSPNVVRESPGPAVTQTSSPLAAKASDPSAAPSRPTPEHASTTAPGSGGQANVPLKASNAPQRAFVPPAALPAEAPVASLDLPAPPGGPAISITSMPAMPDLLKAQTNVSAPPPLASAAPPAAAAVKPAPTSGGKAEPAQLISRVLPTYTGQAREARFTGDVQLTAYIDERGGVTSVTIVKGNPILASAAKKAVMQWKYKPATLNGKAISSSADIKIGFVSDQGK